MYGNVITNKQIKDMITSGALTIDPFDPTKLKAAAYTLTPGRVLTRREDGRYDVEHDFLRNRDAYRVAADGYVIVEPKQVVRINSSGVIGTFITASTNIENGFLVVAGQIDSQYGVNNEALRFGVRNLLSRSNVITCETRLVHLQIIDMRGSIAEPVPLSKEAREVWDGRRLTENWLETHAPNYSEADE